MQSQRRIVEPNAKGAARVLRVVRSQINDSFVINEQAHIKVGQKSNFSTNSLPLYQDAAQALGLSLQDFVTMTKNEILKSLKTGKPCVTSAELRSRQEAYCLIFHNGNIDFYQPSSKAVWQFNHPAKLIKGVGASVGTVQGKVRLLKGGDKGKNVRPGEIIVTAMTGLRWVQH